MTIEYLASDASPSRPRIHVDMGSQMYVTAYTAPYTELSQIHLWPAVKSPRPSFHECL